MSSNVVYARYDWTTRIEKKLIRAGSVAESNVWTTEMESCMYRTELEKK